MKKKTQKEIDAIVVRAAKRIGATVQKPAKKGWVPVKEKLANKGSKFFEKAIAKITPAERKLAVKKLDGFSNWVTKLTTEQAVAHLARQLKKDKSFREVWASNIVMAYIDNENWYKKKTGKKVLNLNDRRIISGNAAEYFLKQLCGEIKVPKGR